MVGCTDGVILLIDNHVATLPHTPQPLTLNFNPVILSIMCPLPFHVILRTLPLHFNPFPQLRLFPTTSQLSPTLLTNLNYRSDKWQFNLSTSRIEIHSFSTTPQSTTNANEIRLSPKAHTHLSRDRSTLQKKDTQPPIRNPTNR